MIFTVGSYTWTLMSYLSVYTNVVVDYDIEPDSFKRDDSKGFFSCDLMEEGRLLVDGYWRGHLEWPPWIRVVNWLKGEERYPHNGQDTYHFLDPFKGMDFNNKKR